MLADAGDILIVSSLSAPADLAGLPDVTLLDLYLGNDDPCLGFIANLRHATRVLVISASGRPADVLGAIRAGSSGYVTKDAEADMVVSAVRTVASGGFAMSSPLADILQSELTRVPREAAGQQSRTLLSPREEQALDFIARGFTHAQTARRMGVTKATVDTYVERIRAKLQVGNKAELTRAALSRITQVEEP
jgi:two-component system nitrate/nitrite response regulator NarL